MEQHHPYRNKPTPAAPSRITGYSGHRPRAYEPVGVGFNRIEYVRRWLLGLEGDDLALPCSARAKEQGGHSTCEGG